MENKQSTKSNIKSIFTNNNEQDYWTLHGINHSLIVDFENNGPCVLDRNYKKQKSTDAMIFGSLLDCLLTQPQEFLKRYHVVDDEKVVSDKFINAFYDIYFEKRNIKSLIEISSDKLYTIAKIYELFPTCKKKETIINKFLEMDASFKEYINARNKKIIKRSIYSAVVDCVDVLLKSDMTSWIFNKKHDIYYQVKLCSSIAHTDIKCMFDFIVVDHENKKILPFDLKYISYPEHQFLQQSFYKFRYYREAELYMYILKKLGNTYFSDYTIEDFRFLVINDETKTPIIYKFPVIYNEQKELQIGSIKTVKPMQDVIADIMWHYKLNVYNYDRRLYEKMLASMNEGDTVEHAEINII